MERELLNFRERLLLGLCYVAVEMVRVTPLLAAAALVAAGVLAWNWVSG